MNSALDLDKAVRIIGHMGPGSSIRSSIYTRVYPVTMPVQGLRVCNRLTNPVRPAGRPARPERSQSDERTIAAGL